MTTNLVQALNVFLEYHDCELVMSMLLESQLYHDPPEDRCSAYPAEEEQEPQKYPPKHIPLFVGWIPTGFHFPPPESALNSLVASTRDTER